MARVETLTVQELGAVLMCCGQLMLDSDLLLGATLDGDSRDFIREQLDELLPEHDADRLDELASIDPEQFFAALNGVEALAWGDH